MVRYCRGNQATYIHLDTVKIFEYTTLVRSNGIVSDVTYFSVIHCDFKPLADDMRI